MKASIQPFTENECAVLSRLSLGDNNKQVASSLGVHVETVWNWNGAMRKRHGVQLMSELLYKYQRWAGLPINPNGLRYTVR